MFHIIAWSLCSDEINSKFNLSLYSDNMPVREGDLEYNTHEVDISQILFFFLFRTNNAFYERLVSDISDRTVNTSFASSSALSSVSEKQLTLAYHFRTRRYHIDAFSLWSDNRLSTFLTCFNAYERSLKIEAAMRVNHDECIILYNKYTRALCSCSFCVAVFTGFISELFNSQAPFISGMCHTDCNNGSRGKYFT